MTVKATATDSRGGGRASTSAALRLCRAAQGGSVEALTELLRGEQDVWYRTGLALLNDEHAAQDAAQETALRFVRGLGGFAGGSTVRTWGVGIAVNVCREMRRRRSKHPRAAVNPALVIARDCPPDASLERDERLTQLRRCVEALPCRQREAVVLRYFERFGVADTAAAMGCAPGTVKATLSHALRRLRREMGGTT